METNTMADRLAGLLDDATDVTTGHRLDVDCQGATITLRFVSRQARDEVLDTFESVLVELLERGTCDTCGAVYGLADRDGRCGDCGDCAGHCRHA